MNALAKLQQRLAGLERVQAVCPSRERSERIAHLRTGIRRLRESTLVAASTTRSPFASN